MPLGADVDLAALAEQCRGYVGADLAALCREAALLALREEAQGDISWRRTRGVPALSASALHTEHSNGASVAGTSTGKPWLNQPPSFSRGDAPSQSLGGECAPNLPLRIKGTRGSSEWALPGQSGSEGQANAGLGVSPQPSGSEARALDEASSSDTSESSCHAPADAGATEPSAREPSTRSGSGPGEQEGGDDGWQGDDSSTREHGASQHGACVAGASEQSTVTRRGDGEQPIGPHFDPGEGGPGSEPGGVDGASRLRAAGRGAGVEIMSSGTGVGEHKGEASIPQGDAIPLKSDGVPKQGAGAAGEERASTGRGLDEQEGVAESRGGEGASQQEAAGEREEGEGSVHLRHFLAAMGKVGPSVARGRAVPEHPALTWDDIGGLHQVKVSHWYTPGAPNQGIALVYPCMLRSLRSHGRNPLSSCPFSSEQRGLWFEV